ncbi:MAG: NAD(+)/NADH kinase [Acidilobaceae archaeon]|nr:NAD(+)/NADH kinase [Acidilobaceae archaeon]
MRPSIGLVVKRQSNLAQEVAKRVASTLRSLGVDFVVEESVDYPEMADYKKFSLKGELPEKLIVVGGDGTLLHTLLLIQRESPLILGVRAGKRGFLLEVDRYEVEERVKDFVEGRYKIVEYPRLAIYANNEPLPCVTNDAVLTAKMGKMVRLIASVDGHVAMRVDGDGIIVSTTIGSTAHALSAGGPVIDPRLRVNVVVPLNPVQLHLRPIVIPSDSYVEISLTANSNEAYLSLDGQITSELGPGSTVAIGPCAHGVRMARFRRGENFYEKLYTRVLTYW